MNYVAGLESEFLLDGSLDLMNLLSLPHNTPVFLFTWELRGASLFQREVVRNN